MGGESGSVDTNAGLAADIAVLEQIRDHGKLDSDRRQAAAALVALRRGERTQEADEEATWIAIRRALEALPPEDRLSFLREQRARARGELGAEAADTGDPEGA
jgi:hypothetical protein